MGGFNSSYSVTLRRKLAKQINNKEFTQATIPSSKSSLIYFYILNDQG